MVESKDAFKDKLSQLHDIRKEISELNTKLKKLEKEEVFKDSVEASSKYFPYTKHNIQITSTKNHKTKELISRYQSILQERYNNLLELQTEIEEYISTIPTSRLRRIIEMRYIDQYTWRKIAYIIGGRATEDSVRKEHDRFLKEN